MGNTKAIEDSCVQSNLICCRWHCSGGRHSKGMLGIDVTAPTDFNLFATQLSVLCKAENQTFSGFCNIRVVSR